MLKIVANSERKVAHLSHNRRIKKFHGNWEINIDIERIFKQKLNKALLVYS